MLRQQAGCSQPLRFIPDMDQKCGSGMKGNCVWVVLVWVCSTLIGTGLVVVVLGDVVKWLVESAVTNLLLLRVDYLYSFLAV